MIYWESLKYKTYIHLISIGQSARNFSNMAEQKIEDLPIVKSLLEHDLPAPSEQQKQVVSHIMFDILHLQPEKAVTFTSICITKV